MFSYGMTDVGRLRATNQDSFIIDRVSPSTLLAVVCDGMGGAAGGLEASSIACSVFADSVEADLERLEERAKDATPALCARILRRGADFANAAVARRAAEDPGLAGMGTTLVAALVSGERVYVANIGDSRLYAIKDGEVSQVTHDHSYVQLLVDLGRMTEEQALHSSQRNIITRAVGTAEDVDCDIFTIDALPDAILLCSDGLTNMLSPDEIGERFEKGVSSEEDARAVCRALIDGANEAGGKDNITAAIVSFAPEVETLDDEEQLPIENADALSAAEGALKDAKKSENGDDVKVARKGFRLFAKSNPKPKSNARSTEKPDTKLSAKSDAKPTEKPSEKSDATPSVKPSVKPNAKPSEKPNKKSSAKPGVRPGARPGVKIAADQAADGDEADSIERSLADLAKLAEHVGKDVVPEND